MYVRPYILKSGSANSSRFLPWLSWKDYEFHGNSSTKCLPVYLFIPDYLWIAGQSNIRLLVRLVLKGVRGLNHWNTLPAAPLMTALNSGNFKIYIFSILDVRPSQTWHLLISRNPDHLQGWILARRQIEPWARLCWGRRPQFAPCAWRMVRNAISQFC